MTNLIWIDGEFTGLNFHNNKIVEIAVVVTDSDLRVLGEPLQLVINHDKKLLDTILEDWPREQFARSGLLNEIQQSTVGMQEAEQQILQYVSEYCESGKSPLCGNGVGQDRRVLYTNMPKLENFLHYRNIDVSTLKELAIRWKPDILDRIQKKESHRALDDIFESIEELKVYRKHFLQ